MNRALPPADLRTEMERRDQRICRAAGRLIRDADTVAGDDAAAALAVALTLTLDMAGIPRVDAAQLLDDAAVLLADRVRYT